MKTIGFVNSHKENESRIALIPDHIKNIKHPEQLFIEKGYGLKLGYEDKDYLHQGANIVSRWEALNQDVICDPKIGDAEYLELLKDKTLFGWLHVVQNKPIRDIIIKNKNTAFAWEDMYEKGRHVFWRNNEIAGEAAIVHAYFRHGIFPYNTKVALLGRGNVAKGAVKTLNYMGADVTSYDRRTEDLFKEEIGNYDVIVNAILWDTKRKDHIIHKKDLSRMKKGAMIIDISCDRNGAIETSLPTSIENPDYFVEGIRHYVVDHTPSLFYKSASIGISEEVSKYIDYFITNQEFSNPVLSKACCIFKGEIRDLRMID